MSTPTLDRMQLIESIKALPDDALVELSNFVGYLQFKEMRTPKMTGQECLLSIAGLGQSGETDISERDEEILAQEVDPIQGWGVRVDEST